MIEFFTAIGYAYLAIGAATALGTFISTRPQKAVPTYARTVWACGLGLTWPVALGIQLNALPYGQPRRS